MSFHEGDPSRKSWEEQLREKLDRKAGFPNVAESDLDYENLPLDESDEGVFYEIPDGKVDPCDPCP